MHNLTETAVIIIIALIISLSIIAWKQSQTNREKKEDERS